MRRDEGIELETGKVGVSNVIIGIDFETNIIKMPKVNIYLLFDSFIHYVIVIFYIVHSLNCYDREV